MVKTNQFLQSSTNIVTNFTETQQYQMPKAWDDRGSGLKAFQTTTLKDCKEACITNKGCNSIMVIA